MPTSFGKILIGLGLLLVLVGIIVLLGDKLNWPDWLRPGRLPGDIAVKRKNFSFYFPLATSLLLSLLLTLILWLIRRLGS